MSAPTAVPVNPKVKTLVLTRTATGQDPNVTRILDLLPRVGAPVVKHMLWLYDEEFKATADKIIAKLDVLLTRGPVCLDEVKLLLDKHSLLGVISHHKFNRLKKEEWVAFKHPLEKQSCRQFMKLHEHVEKSLRFAFAGDKVKALKYAKKLESDMDSIWMNLTEMSEKNLEIRRNGCTGEHALKMHLDRIVQLKKMCEEQIARVCK